MQERMRNLWMTKCRQYRCTLTKAVQKKRDMQRAENDEKERFYPLITNGILLSVIFIMGIFCFQLALSFADPADKHLTLQEIVVIGDTVNEPMSTDVGKKKIEKGKNINIPDVLKNEPDIDLKRRALIGDTADNLAIRGLSGNRILLNINERPVNACGVVGGYYIDWGTIPLDNIEKIELIRGGSSVRYGNSALGGVVNVITKKPTTDPTLTFFGTYGGGYDVDSFQNYRLTHTYKVGPLGYSLAASYQKADPFLWNNDFEGKNAAASIFLDMPFDGDLMLGFQYANSKRGFIRENRRSTNPNDPGFDEEIDDDYPLAFGETFSPNLGNGNALKPGPRANWDKTKYYLDVGYTQPIYDAILKFKIYKNYEDRRERNYSSSYLNPAYSDGELVFKRNVESDRSYGGSIELSRAIGSHEVMIGGEHKVLAYGDTDTHYIDLTYNNVWWVTEDDFSFKPSSKGVCWAAYAQDTWQISDRWLLTGGLRYDHYKNKSINGSTSPELEDDAVMPKLTATYQMTDNDTLTASLYQALRTPGLPETYWWAEGVTHGEPLLKPEKNTAAEMFFQHDFSRSDYIRFAAYYYYLDDYIIFRFDPNGDKYVYNIDKVRLYGTSLDGKYAFTDWLSGNASVTWQKSEKYGDSYDTAGLSDEIDYLHEWKASAGLEFKLPYQAVLNTTVRYVGERQAIYGYRIWPQQYFKLVELGPYVTADINLKVPLGNHVELNCYVENLFDEEYEEQFGYPMPGLIAGAGMKVSF